MQYKPDFETIEPYARAFWACDMIDRVAVAAAAPRKKGAELFNWHSPTTVNQMGNDELLDKFEQYCAAIYHGGLSVPAFWPNLGPDVFSAFLGADLKFSADSRDTSWIDWSQPVLADYNDLSRLEIHDDNPWYRRILDFTRRAVERGRGKFLVGHTDVHAGFDALAVLRGGPEVASMDLVEHPEGVQAAMKKLYTAWQKVFDDAYALVGSHQKGTSNWIGIWFPGRMYTTQNDFSCLVSNAMYREFFLEELEAELNHLDASIYHLDGVEALQHLDMLLELPRLNAIQWVSGAKYAGESIARWIPLFQKIQAKKKAIVTYPRSIEEVTLLLENLKPEGLLIQFGGTEEEEARAVMKMCGW